MSGRVVASRWGQYTRCITRYEFYYALSISLSTCTRIYVRTRHVCHSSRNKRDDTTAKAVRRTLNISPLKHVQLLWLDDNRHERSCSQRRRFLNRRPVGELHAGFFDDHGESILINRHYITGCAYTLRNVSHCEFARKKQELSTESEITYRTHRVWRISRTPT